MGAIPVDRVALYPGMSVESLTTEATNKNDEADQVVNGVLKRALQNAQRNKEAQKKSGALSSEKAVQQRDAGFSSLLKGEKGAVAQQAAQLLEGTPLGHTLTPQTKEGFTDVTQKTPQAGFAAANEFQKLDPKTAMQANQSVVVLTDASKQNKDLKVVGEQLSGLLSSFNDSQLGEGPQRKFLQPGAVADPNVRQAGKDLAKVSHRLPGSIQEKAANLGIKDPSKLTEVVQSFTKATDGQLSPKGLQRDLVKNGGAMFDGLLNAKSVSVTDKAYETFLSQAKGFGSKTFTAALVTVGRTPNNTPQMLHAASNLRPTQQASFFRKLDTEFKTKGEISKDAIASAEVGAKKPLFAFPPIGRVGARDGEQPQTGLSRQQIVAKWSVIARKIEKHNDGLLKQIKGSKTEEALRRCPAPMTWKAVIGEARSKEELQALTGCSAEEAEHVWALAAKEDGHIKSSGLAKALSTQKRLVRGKHEPRGEHRSKRSESTTGVSRRTLTLTDEGQSNSAVSFHKLIGQTSSATDAPVQEVGVNATAAPSQEEIAARNSQTIRPAGKAMRTSGGLAGWGANARAVGMDPEVERKKLAALKESKREAHRADATQLSSGPMIARAGETAQLADIVSNKTPWRDLNSASKAVLRNLGLTPQVLESWYEGSKRIYSPLQAKPWEQLTEIQQKSAQLLGLHPDNWNALASMLSQNVRPTAPLRNAATTHKINHVAMKSRA